MSTDLIKWTEELRQSITHAALNYEVWWVLYGKDTDDELIKALNKYKRFHLTLRRSYMITLIVDLYKLYETKGDRWSLAPLIKNVVDGKLISEKAISEIDEIYRNKAKPIWKKVCILRNNVYAHSSNTVSIEKAYKQANVSPYELRDLINHSKIILNMITSELFNSQHAFNTGVRKEALQLLSDLNGHHR